MEHAYTVFEHEITTYLSGDREETAGWDVSDELDVYGLDLVEILERVAHWMERDVIAVNWTRHGIGSITRPVYEVAEWIEDDDGEWHVSGEPLVFDLLDMRDGYRAAWERAKLSYCAFLDYEADSYADVLDELTEV